MKPDQMTAVQFEAWRHECEVNDWVRRIKERPKDKRAGYWRQWRDTIKEHRGEEAAMKLHRAVLAEMLK